MTSRVSRIIVAAGLAAASAWGPLAVAQEPGPAPRPRPATEAPPPRPAAAAPVPTGATRDGLTTIEFRREHRFRTDAELEAVMGTKAGRPLIEAVLQEDLRRLALHGIFVRSVERLPTPEAPTRLVLHVDERPVVRGVQVHDATVLGETELRDAGGYRVGDVLVDPLLLERAREGIRDAYRRKGYRFTHVACTTEPAGAGVTLVYRVSEGPKTWVTGIEFRGVSGLDPDALREVMGQKAGGFFSGETLDDAKLGEDVARLETTFRTRGWLDARVALGELRVSPDGSEVTIVIVVEEGRRYTVGAVRLDGAKAIPEKSLRELVDLPVGAPLDGRRTWGDPDVDPDGDVGRIRKRYEADGYAKMRVNVETRVLDAAAGTVEVVYRIFEGVPTKIGRVDIVGNHHTREDVARRLLPFAPGDVMRTDAIREGLLRLYQSRFFKSVEPRTRETADPGVTDIIMAVEDSDTSGSLNFGGAYNPSVGLVGQFSISFANFDLGKPSWPWNLFVAPHWRGGGQELRFDINAGGSSSNYRLEFREPYLFGTNNTLSLDGHIGARDYSDYDERREGVRVSLGRRLASWLHVGVPFTAEWINIRNVNPFGPPELLALDALGRKTLAKLGLSVDFDWTTRDALRLPWKGFSLDTGFDWAHQAIGSHWNFWHVGLGPRFHWTLFGEQTEWRQVVSVKGDLDYAYAFGDTREVPFFERFFAGGYGTIRGFDFRDLGPRELGRPVGGTFRATASVEYSLPLYRDTLPGSGGQKGDIIRLVFFYDLCTLNTDWEDYSTSTWRSSIGFGFRLQVPGFPVPFALDFARPLRKLDGDDTELISFFFDLRV